MLIFGALLFIFSFLGLIYSAFFFSGIRNLACALDLFFYEYIFGSTTYSSSYQNWGGIYNIFYQYQILQDDINEIIRINENLCKYLMHCKDTNPDPSICRSGACSPGAPTACLRNDLIAIDNKINTLKGLLLALDTSYFYAMTGRNLYTYSWMSWTNILNDYQRYCNIMSTYCEYIDQIANPTPPWNLGNNCGYSLSFLNQLYQDWIYWINFQIAWLYIFALIFLLYFLFSLLLSIPILVNSYNYLCLRNGKGIGRISRNAWWLIGILVNLGFLLAGIAWILTVFLWDFEELFNPSYYLTNFSDNCIPSLLSDLNIGRCLNYNYNYDSCLGSITTYRSLIPTIANAINLVNSSFIYLDGNGNYRFTFPVYSMFFEGYDFYYDPNCDKCDPASACNVNYDCSKDLYLGFPLLFYSSQPSNPFEYLHQLTSANCVMNKDSVALALNPSQILCKYNAGNVITSLTPQPGYGPGCLIIDPNRPYSAAELSARYSDCGSATTTIVNAILDLQNYAIQINSQIATICNAIYDNGGSTNFFYDFYCKYMDRTVNIDCNNLQVINDPAPIYRDECVGFQYFPQAILCSFIRLAEIQNLTALANPLYCNIVENVINRIYNSLANYLFPTLARIAILLTICAFLWKILLFLESCINRRYRELKKREKIMMNTAKMRGYANVNAMF